MYQVRKYQAKDKLQVEGICLGSTQEALQVADGSMQQALLDVFCHYYIEAEPANCFVAVDEDDQAVGYVLCAKDFSKWKQVFIADYIDPSTNLITKGMGQGTIQGLEDFATQYPAHLHIDIAEAHQRKGLGTLLMDTLIAHLKAENVAGLVLCVAADNAMGKSFYNKYGMEVLKADKQQSVMGIQIKPIVK